MLTLGLALMASGTLAATTGQKKEDFCEKEKARLATQDSWLAISRLKRAAKEGDAEAQAALDAFDAAKRGNMGY